MTQFQEKDVIIIGAGISGLACALGLKESGFNNVRILEARNRIGGRIQTAVLGPYFVEVGAHWIHGEKDNIIYEIAKSNDFVDYKATNYMDSITNFNCLPEKDRYLINGLIEYLDYKMSETSIEEVEDSSVFSHLKKHFNVFLNDYPDPTQRELLHQGFDWFCKFQCELNGCRNLTLLSKKLLGAYKECDGLHNVELKQGYHSILNLFLRSIPNEWILKNRLVTKIDWSELVDKSDFESSSSQSKEKSKRHNVIKVFCENGEVYYSNHVVVTVPLGYLKKFSKSLFYPCLNEKKQLAISCLGFDAVNKLFLLFKIPFWEQNAVINVLWSKQFDDYFRLENSYQNENPVDPWVKDINRFAYTHGHSKMLCAWVTGEGAVKLETLSNDIVENDCMKLLELLFQRKLPKPICILRSSWSKDSLTFGSYSYLSVECEKNNVSQVDIAEPEYSNSCSSQINKYPALLFAGEASHDCHFSTVHGACESGFREAERLFQYYRNQDLLTNSDEILLSRKMAKLLSSKENLNKNLKIVIVGAGIAGLSCASHLVENHFTQVRILEAQNRIGGRIHSIKYGNCALELGAQWIHGTENELYKFSKKHGILSTVIDNLSSEGEGIFYTSSGKVIDSNIVKEVKEVMNEAKAMLEKAQYSSKYFKSVGCAFSEVFTSYMEKNKNDPNILLKKGLFDWFIKFEIIDNACDSLNTIASQSYAEWDNCPSDTYHVNTNKGFSTIVDTLRSKIPEVNISLNKPVKVIKWRENIKKAICIFKPCLKEEYPVCVECEDGTRFPADCVVVTASIGFLKEKSSTFFDPPLPLNKMIAFETIGFGTINKIFLVYENAFWHANDLGIQFVWTDDRSNEAEKLLTQNPWIKGITGFDVVRQLPNVLLGWVGGEEAKMFENITDYSVCLVCTELFKLFCNCTDIPSPVKIFRSQWFLNPYIRGAYSNRSLKYYERDSSLYDLQCPLSTCFVTNPGIEVQWPSVLFAGEAYDQHSFSSAHGAFRSGLKAAESVIKFSSEIEI